MSKIQVKFEYLTGISAELFQNIRLTGSWGPERRYSDSWQTQLMQPVKGAYGHVYTAVIELEDSEVGKQFFWNVLVDTPWQKDLSGITTESELPEHPGLIRSFTLAATGSLERYWLTPCRSLGANKYFHEDGSVGICFSAWAPHAQKVETVIAADDSGYIWDDDRGVASAFSMEKDVWGIWRTANTDPALSDYNQWKGRHYMFRVTREDGSKAYRTDLFSRSQAGSGGKNPAKEDWNGQATDLDSTKSCSVVKDPEEIFLTAEGPQDVQTAADFWKNEYDNLRPVPTRIEDLVIYEMHVAGLGANHEGPGTLKDAMEMLDYLVDLGINTVELLPMSGFEGVAGWGYGSSHFYAIKYEPGARDQFKQFVRACHQRGIAVIVDVVYNHYSPDNDRCQWMYDTTRHDHNMYYYYKGQLSDYPEDFPEGGYCDNYSTGYLPNVGEEMVRKMMIGSAVSMALEYHVDGFRMDLTQALHSFNVLHKDGSPVPEANEAGIRFMKEWARTIHLCKPGVMLIAEDHSGWNMVARAPISGGIGFNTVWWSEWYHQLIGDATEDASKARLLHNAGYGTRKPLAMNTFASVLQGSPGKIVYHSSHDEVGNSKNSARDIEVAVNGMLFDNTRSWGEARCRVVAGLTFLSAGTPMFFMGEEVAATQPYRFGDFLEHREDFRSLRENAGAAMFRFYRDIIRLRLGNAALRSPFVDIVKVHNQNRILSFRRWWNNDEFLIIASLNDQAFSNGYSLGHKNLKGKQWKEIFSSDRKEYGGSGSGNLNVLDSTSGSLTLYLPANSILVFSREN